MKRFALFLFACAASVGILSAQPQPKSQEELEALIAIQEAATPQARIEAAKTLLQDFKDTEFKAFANMQMMVAAQQMNDYENILVYGEETLKHDPEDVGALLTLASAIPMRTQEFDLDKEEKLARAEDYANKALMVVPNKEKPNPAIPDEQWLMAKKDFMSDAHKSLGLIEFKRENYEAAVDHYQQSLEVAAQQDPTVFYFMAEAQLKAGDKEAALASVERSIAAGGFPLGDGQDAAQILKEKIESGN